MRAALALGVRLAPRPDPLLDRRASSRGRWPRTRRASPPPARRRVGSSRRARAREVPAAACATSNATSRSTCWRTSSSMSRPICSGSAFGEVPSRSMWVRLQFDASACTGSRWVTTNRASGCTLAIASSASRWHGHFSAHRRSGAPHCSSRSTRAWYSYASLQVGGVQQVLEVARDRHRPQQPGVDEGLVEDGQALLRTVDVGEVERVDLAARRLVRPARVLDARLVPPADRLGVGRGRRHRPFTFPRAQHAQVGVLVEEVLEVRRSRSRAAR